MKGEELFSIFKQFSNLKLLLSQIQDGGMKIRYELPNDRETFSHRKRFFNKHTIPSNQVVVAQLAQANRVSIVTEDDWENYIPKTDGLITQQKGVFLSITVADCLPIYLYDTKTQSIALLHAGWKGLDTGIISNAIDMLQTSCNVSPENLLVGIGPCIAVCHFAVKENVLNRFSSYQNVIQKRQEEYFVNLKEIARQQLLRKHILKNNIEINPLCTYCEKNRFFSYRRDKKIPLQAMVATFGIE